MAWYRTGTVAVTNGSPVVTGTGTDFVSNVSAGDSWQGPDGNAYEVAGVTSSTTLTLASSYLGATASGQAFAVQPTQSYVRDLALSVATLIGTFASVRDGIGQGLIPDGTLAAPGVRFSADQDTGVRRFTTNSLSLVTGGVDRAIIDASGNLLVGVASAPNHTIARGTTQGDLVLNVSGLAAGSARFFSASNGTINASASAIQVSASGTTARSINTAGTINASGADYAEYVRKAPGCGTIAKGDVCGIDANGQLTRSWAAAVRYVVKSTDPNLVGGDSWAVAAGPRPEQQKDEADDAFTARTAVWEAVLETARATVDRVAFCGQVPVNVDADTLAACEAALADNAAVYLVAVANGGGIGVSAVRATDMTLPLYMNRLGAVWAITDGRPIIDVQHG